MLTSHVTSPTRSMPSPGSGPSPQGGTRACGEDVEIRNLAVYDRVGCGVTSSHDLVYLCRELKAPSLLAGVERLTERARTDAWSRELPRRLLGARGLLPSVPWRGEPHLVGPLPARKTLEDFDFDHQRSVRKDVVAHLGALDFIEARSNAVFLGPPGTGKSHLSIALGIRACLAGHRVAFTRPRPNGSTDCKQPMTPASCKTSSVAWGDTRSSSLTRWDTSPFRARRPISFSSWSRVAL